MLGCGAFAANVNYEQATLQQPKEYILVGWIFCKNAPFASADVKMALATAVAVTNRTGDDGTFMFTVNRSVWSKHKSAGLSYQAYSLIINASVCSANVVVLMNGYPDQILPQLSSIAEFMVPTGLQLCHKALFYIRDPAPGCPASSAVSQSSMTMYFPHVLQIADLTGACAVQYIPEFNASLKPPANIYTPYVQESGELFVTKLKAKGL